MICAQSRNRVDKEGIQRTVQVRIIGQSKNNQGMSEQKYIETENGNGRCEKQKDFET